MSVIQDIHTDSAFFLFEQTMDSWGRPTTIIIQH